VERNRSPVIHVKASKVLGNMIPSRPTIHLWRCRGERAYSSYLFTTSTLDGVSGQRHVPAALLPPGKGPTVPIVQEAGWAPEPVWTQRAKKKSFASAGDRTPIARSSIP
jgi:hypothetical protein